MAYDKAVEREEKTEYDLSPEQQKTARKFTRTGTRKTPTVYKFTKKERKPDETKSELIAELANFLEKNTDFSIKNLQITNKTRQISFMMGEETFELTLTRKNKTKK